MIKSNNDFCYISSHANVIKVEKRKFKYKKTFIFMIMHVKSYIRIIFHYEILISNIRLSKILYFSYISSNIAIKDT